MELEPGVTGMVHISEVANTFVNEIRDHLTEGQQVKVKVLAVSEDGKISLSIKKALPPQPKKEFRGRPDGGNRQGGDRRPRQDKFAPKGAADSRVRFLRICSTSSRQAPMSAWAI
ncbi:MAG: S1 RNA-binding domain-containing protein [Ruminococcus sp.]|nr:MAG: S1 RNA-binding domain-containing protein [Ruminococcus sp.]